MSVSSRPLLEAQGLEYSIDENRILAGIDFGVSEGELVGIIGPNGAGKTTLLRLLCGLIRPSGGSVLLSRRRISDIPHKARARLISYMSQDDVADLGFKVIDIVLMGRYPHLGAFKSESGEDREVAGRMLSYVGLPGFEERMFRDLSGGERQLALFAKTLVQEAGCVLLDEPSSHLDMRHEDSIFSMAQELAREGRAVVASVHNLNVAARYCTSLLLLDKGSAAGRGEPGAVLRPEVLGPVYGVKTLVSRSAGTGNLTVEAVPLRAAGRNIRVHIIGGAGSAINLTRELYRLGFALSGGIAHAYDSDESLWTSLGISHHSVNAFSRISEADVRDAVGMVENAEITVLCSFPIGMGNIGNLKLAARAKRLAVLLPRKYDAERSFFAPEARQAFEDLCRGAQIMTHEDLLGLLMSGSPGNEAEASLTMKKV